MLERIGVLEPGVEHAVGIHDVRPAQLVQHLAGDITVVLPQPIDDEKVVVPRVLFQPLADVAVQAIAEPARPGEVHRSRIVDSEVRIQRQYINPMPVLDKHLVNFPSGIDGAAIFRFNRRYDS